MYIHKLSKKIIGALILFCVCHCFGITSFIAAENKGSDGGPRKHIITSATSFDGVTFRLDHRILLRHASVPCTVMAPNKRIRSYFVDASRIPEGVNCAESKDQGRTFRKLGCKIFGLSSVKAVDPSIVVLPDGTYRLYYYASDKQTDTLEEHNINLAVSKDGIRFHEVGTVFTYPGLVDPDIYFNGNTWILASFSLADHANIIATSPDGLHFTYAGTSTIMHHGLTAPSKVETGGFRMFAFDQSNQTVIHSFTSIDELQWTQEEGTRLEAPIGFEITDPFVVKVKDGLWKMFFKQSKAPPKKG